MSSYLFNGRKYPMNTPDKNSDHPGDSMEKMIAVEIARAFADQRALQAAQADWAKRVREENRAVARLIGAAFEEEETNGK